MKLNDQSQLRSTTSAWRCVDKMDMLLSLYRLIIRTREWYLRIAFHLFSLAAVNSWILYKELGGSNNLVKFLTELSIDLIQERPPVDTDTDTGSNEVEKPKQVCKTQSSIQTSKV